MDCTSACPTCCASSTTDSPDIEYILEHLQQEDTEFHCVATLQLRMLLLHHSSSPCCPQRIKKMGNDAQLVKMQSQLFAPVNIVYSKKPFYEKFCPLGGHYCTRKSSYYWSRQYQCGRHLADIQQEDEPSAFERINSASCYRVCQLFAQRFASLPLVMP